MAHKKKLQTQHFLRWEFVLVFFVGASNCESNGRKRVTLQKKGCTVDSKFFKKDYNSCLILSMKLSFSKNNLKTLNPFQFSVTFHIETSHLFCRAKQMTGFYMKHNTGPKYRCGEKSANFPKESYQ